ncbi:hypothetical protein [Desulfatirhabdium butyrativorans]|nr:hypothetical protein [Desulfatirhabdium butyrativorans]
MDELDEKTPFSERNGKRRPMMAKIELQDEPSMPIALIALEWSG